MNFWPPGVILRWLGVKIPYALTLQEGDPFEYMFNRPHILPLMFQALRVILDP